MEMDYMDDLSSRGGRARAAKLSPERRRLIASAAAGIRWAKHRPPRGTISETEKANELPPSPFAKHQGVLDLGGTPVDVYVLDTEEHVISLRATVKAIADVDAGNLGDYIGAQALRSFLDKDSVLGETKDFHIPGTQLRGKGITAERFLEVCRAYVSALQQKALSTDRQREIAIRCSIVLSSCAKVGLIALIDEATGYQFERAEDALQVKLRAFIAEELREWEKTFPDELWEEFGRLTNWQGALHSRPKWWGKLVIELIYDTLDPDVAQYLRENKPPIGVKWHQQLTENYGVRQLVSRCFEIVGIARTSQTMRELRDKVAEHYGTQEVQLTFRFARSPRRLTPEEIGAIAPTWPIKPGKT
jgi:P63C domain-containing protein